MKKLLFTVTITALTLISCATQHMMFGMPESQFHQLSTAQQNQVIDSYNRQQEQERQNEQIGHALNTLEYLGKLNAKNN